jgi:hypothetical protein
VINLIIQIRDMGYHSPPPNRNLVLRFGRRGDSNRNSKQSHIPQHGNMKSGWREQRESLLSQVTSSSEWLLQCILKNLIVLRLVT